MKPSTTVGGSLGSRRRAVLIIIVAVVGMRATSGQEAAPATPPSPELPQAGTPPADVPPLTLPTDPPSEAVPPMGQKRPPDGIGGGMGGPGGGPGGPGYSATWYPSRAVVGGGFGGLPSSLGLVRQNLSVGVPIWASPPDTLMLNATVGHTLFQTDAVLPDTRRAFPSELWNVNLGLMYVRKLDDGWSVGGMFGFGSSSDKPFHSVRELNLMGMAFLSLPAFEGRDSWRFSLMYSPVGALNFPIPGVTYQWNPSERLSVGVGIPLSVNWRPDDDWTINATYMPLTNVNARITRRITDEWKVYAAYEWRNESYFLVDRVTSADRFIGLEQRVFGGMTHALGERLTVDVHAGYAFGRQYAEGANVGGAQHDRIEVSPGAFLGGSLRLKF